MANITPVLDQKIDERSRSYIWETITEADEGASIQVSPAYPDKTVHFVGTFNGGTLTLEHSMDAVSWTSAKEADGTVISTAAAESFWVATNARYWRVANNNSGTSEDVDVWLIVGLS